MINYVKPQWKNVAEHIPAIFAIIVVVLTVGQSYAKEVPELITDRPDQTESSVTVSRGKVQIETGLTYSEEDEKGQRSRTFEAPGTLFRIGMRDRIELRLGFAGEIREDVTAEDGFGDSEMGLKIYFCEEYGRRPETALLTSLSLPTGDKGFSSERADPSFRLLFSHTLTDRFSLGYNLGAAWETDEDARGERDTLAVFQYTATIGIGLTSRLGTFVEIYGDIPLNVNGNPANSFDCGFTYLIRDNLQFDIAGGIGLSDDADDWFVGVGMSYRFPQ